jgi:hypothetical protein
MTAVLMAEMARKIVHISEEQISIDIFNSWSYFLGFGSITGLYLYFQRVESKIN